ncbi:MAG TPA: YbfB/YjiJ family MFS transporter [Azospirillaceae bacterium]|nr:YbfB/YjiJ family MFS transporter [Azospirillaceae bacterium]
MSEARARGGEAGAAAAAHTRGPALWAFAGFCALFLGVGLGRFAYTPLLPALVDHGWLAGGEAAYLGAANLGGYLIGALASQRIGVLAGPGRALRWAMAATALTFAACALPWGFWWLLLWRSAAGFSGAVLMILAAPVVLAAVPPAARGRAAGIMFTGVGLGIVLSGTFVAWLADAGPRPAWLVLALAGVVLTAAAWRLWPAPAPRISPAAAAAAAGAVPDAGARGGIGSLPFLVAAYACDGAGFVPHSLFLSDYVARGLDRGVAAGAQYWMLFGVGAALGAAVVGIAAGRFGFRASYLAAFLVKAVAVALPLVTDEALAIAVSAVIVGALTPGMGALGSGVSAEAAGPANYARAWRSMTLGFALAQAGGAYGFSWLFAETGSYRLLFAVGTALLVMGAGCAALGGRPWLRRG